ncbi:restriction endonuclease subunit S [Rheinheimera aquimaris]|uniref:restriction endonuclease subunit S n=1 Tax=Rheinheimera aquimaris TaxID=412437 RepID=UPI001E558E75|nr:restriction endonuclease subunit S [Rheinheimera aquimaris]MCD1597363.1 restriction endonuclease subunit S [Rheinheimera aquimaris]
MTAVQHLITDHLDLWTTAIKHKSSAGRGSNKKIELYGIKKLRELILELAVRGLLVPQDPSDEPASELLNKIAAEKEALVKTKAIRKSKELVPITHEEIPFEIPRGWVATRLGSIGDWGAGATPSRSRPEYYGGDIPWFKSGELTDDFIDFSEEKVTTLALKDCSLRLNKAGDVLIAMYGATIGKVSILNVEGTTNQAVCACTPFCGITNVFLLTLLKAYKNRFVGMGAGGAQPNISREKIIATPILLPPLNEQSRIIARVDELMALCDQLEQQSYEQIDTHNALIDALLTSITQPEATASTTALELLFANFDSLFTTAHSIDQLKQSILQLAVMGKLVPQDPNDEPASELLKKIAAEKEALVKTKVIRKSKELAPITHEEIPFKIPRGWVATRLGSIGDWGAGATPSRSRPEYYGGGIPWFKSGELTDDFIDFSEEKVTALAIKDCSLRLNKAGDVLIAMYGATIGKVSILNVEGTTNQAVCACTPFCGITNVFLLTLLKAYKNRFVGMGAGGAQPNISREKIIATPILLPPLNEQSRIITRVGELMALCDQLKAELTNAQSTQLQLADALAEQALAV